MRHADIVAFTCLKAIAFDQRAERKDAHDLIYCLMHYEPQDGLHRLFQPALQGKHGEAVAKALEILRRKFASQDDLEGYRKDGPTAVALFEQGEDPASREQRIVRQRSARSSSSDCWPAYKAAQPISSRSRRRPSKRSLTSPQDPSDLDASGLSN